ncbi:MAG: alpha/beta fold hydrolase [Bacteroidetes bacterium]|nr:alpha/beta fold hydrolase [Bacteroidota bacterium]
MNPDTAHVLFAHANGFTAPVYEKFLSATGFKHNHSLERLGHGPLGIGPNWTGIVLELTAFAQTLPAPRIGIGHSLGAFSLYRAALANPGLFDALVLMEPPMFRPMKRRQIQGIRMLGFLDRFPPVSLAKKRRRVWPDLAQARHYMLQRPFYASLDPAVFNDYLRYGLEPLPTGELGLRFLAEVEYEIFRQGPPPVDPFTKRFPLLFLYGTHTKVLQPADLAYVHQQLKGASFQAVDGGHLFPLEHPKAAGQLVGDWIRSLV